MKGWTNRQLSMVVNTSQKAKSPSMGAMVWNLNLDQIESHSGRVLQKVYANANELGTSTYSFEPRTVLYSKLRPYLNKVIVADEAGVATTELVPIRCDTDEVLPEYLAYFLRSPHFLKFATMVVAGAKMPRMVMSEFWNYKVPLPPFPEQVRIAAILDQADVLRVKRREALAQLDSLTQSIFIEMFGDPVTNPKGWEKDELGMYCDLFNGFAFKSSDYVEKSETLNCRMSNIRPSGEFDADYNPKYLPDLYAQTYKAYVLRDDDVIIAMTDMATEAKILGVPTVVNTKGKTFLLNQRVGKLLINNSNALLFPFLKQLLAQSYVKKYYQRFAGGGLQINLGKGDLLSLSVIIPPVAIQREFAQRMTVIGRLKETYKASLAELDNLFTSLQHRAFRGEL